MIEVVALGGLGQFGMNMMAITTGTTRILIDAGVAFPDGEMPGVDLVIPALDYLESGPPPCALLLTHGHEDHIGAVPYVLPLLDGPLVGTRLTVEMALQKAADHEVSVSCPPRVLAGGGRFSVGEFEIEFISVNHSIPDSVAVALHCNDGTLVHTGDFKCDPTSPDGTRFDFDRLSALGRQGILALFSDSTNADRAGTTPSELSVLSPLRTVFATTPGRIIATTFSTSLYRIQLLVDLADESGRRVAFLGRSMLRNVEIAKRLGHLKVPAGLEIADEDLRSVNQEEVLCIVTGSQGQPTAVLPRIARGDYRHLDVDDRDTVILSARAIPGNERLLHRVENGLARRGVRFVSGERAGVHVSGHASQQDLRMVLSLLRPRHFVPIHGEYLQLAAHARLAMEQQAGIEVLLANNGDRIVFKEGRASKDGTIPVGRVLLDGGRTGRVSDETLRDRRTLANEGLLAVVVALDSQGHVLAERLEVLARGLPMSQTADSLLDRCKQHLANRLQELTGRTLDAGYVREFIVSELHRLLHDDNKARPLVVPIVLVF